MEDRPKVILVDDDADVRNSIKSLFTAVRLEMIGFDSAESFMASNLSGQAGCLLLDVRMPGMGGLKLLEFLQSVKDHPPVIIFTGYGDVPMVLQSLKSGAFAFLEKSATHQQLLDCVWNALAFDREMRTIKMERENVEMLLSRLSPRELEVMNLMVDGLANKQMAGILGISERTLEKHRKCILLKTEARSVVELIKMLVKYQENIRHGL